MPTTNPHREYRYLGDGVYASFELGDLTLETDRNGITHWIVLEPQVYAAMVEYMSDHAKEKPPCR